MEYPFTISGGLDVADNHEPIHDAQGNTVGFELPDGRRVKLVMALEVEDPAKDLGRETFAYVTDTDGMEALGFRNLDYDRLEFEADFISLVHPTSPAINLAQGIDGPSSAGSVASSSAASTPSSGRPTSTSARASPTASAPRPLVSSDA